MAPLPGDVQSKMHQVEATKTEPDKNTYLVLDGQKGPDAGYDYGKHFLFQATRTARAAASSAPSPASISTPTKPIASR